MNDADWKAVEGVLCVDLYELTMAQVYFRQGIHENRALFEHSFRSYPHYGDHQAGYCVNAGLEWFIDWARGARFRREDVDRLRGLRARTGGPLFAEDFLRWLERDGDLGAVTIRAVPEGRVVHPNVPVTTAEGPLALVQMLETRLLMDLNYQTLIATKAARVRQSGLRQMLIEFGTRRAQWKGALAGARAALIGGADYSSNVGISCVLGIQPKGTHAHSMVQAFMALGGGELDAFRAFADVYPGDCVLLVDTVDTLESGVPNAIRVFDELRRRGHEPVGIRLDSGDLAYLSVQAAKLLNEAGYPDVKIVLSNALDELVLLQIITQIHEEAPRYGLSPDAVTGRLMYGVGTRLITSAGAPALDGVYKLVALERDGAWNPIAKLSETVSKTTNPGRKNVWRLYDVRRNAVADLLALESEDIESMESIVLRHPTDHAAHRTLDRRRVVEMETLLVDVMRDGRLVYEFPPIEAIRERRELDIDRLDPGVRRIINPHVYHVSLTQRLFELKFGLVRALDANHGGGRDG
jgi:nicotinate phosphoribosyltransferase